MLIRAPGFRPYLWKDECSGVQDRAGAGLGFKTELEQGEGSRQSLDRVRVQARAGAG